MLEAAGVVFLPDDDVRVRAASFQVAQITTNIANFSPSETAVQKRGVEAANIRGLGPRGFEPQNLPTVERAKGSSRRTKAPTIYHHN